MDIEIMMAQIKALTERGYSFRATGTKGGWKVEIYGPDAMCVGKDRSDGLLMALGNAIDDAGDHLPAYQIETRRSVARGWTTEGLGPGDNRFSTPAEAEAAIAGLRALGDEWAAADYRVVEVAS